VRPIVADWLAWCFCLSVRWSVATLSPAKTAEPMEMPFRMWTRVGPVNHVLDEGPHHHMQRGNFDGKKLPAWHMAGWKSKINNSSSTASGWPPLAHRPSQLTWALSLPVNGCYHPHPPLPFIILTQPNTWYLCYCPSEGGKPSQPRYCSKGMQPVPKAVCCTGCHDKRNCPQWNTKLGLLTLQSGCYP